MRFQNGVMPCSPARRTMVSAIPLSFPSLHSRESLHASPRLSSSLCGRITRC
jgi:hypothetical protein